MNFPYYCNTIYLIIIYRLECVLKVLFVESIALFQGQF